MAIVGDASVISCLRGMPVPDGKKRIYICVSPSGAKSGFNSAVEFKVLEEEGITASCFDYVLGTSAGFFNLMGYCAKQAHITPDIYLHIADKPWLKPGGRKGRWLTFYDYLMDILSGNVLDGVKFDMEAFCGCPARKIAAVSDLQGRVVYHEVIGAENVFPLMQAASAIVPFSLGKTVGGKKAIDGAYAHSHCQFARLVKQVLRQADRDTDVCVLFVANRPGVEYLHWAEALGYWFGVAATLWWSPRLLASALKIDKKAGRSELMFSKPVRPGIRLCAIVPDRKHSVNPWEWDPAYMARQGEGLAGSLRQELSLLAV